MTDWVKRTQTIQVGDRVGYSKQFLRSTSQFTGDVPFARGTVTALKAIGSDTVLAEIDWDTPDMPARVHVKNLVTVKGMALE